MDTYNTKHPKQQPNLTETERLVLRTFVSNIEERLIVRLFNIVKQFEVTDKLIIFYVPEQNQQDFVNWLNAIDICKIFFAYNREILSISPSPYPNSASCIVHCQLSTE